MDTPQPPADQEQHNIIDKLAQFVARNGVEFENMTRNKQIDNPKFAFLSGGEYYNYYQYRVTTEQAIQKHKHDVPTSQGPLAQMGGGIPLIPHHNPPALMQHPIAPPVNHSSGRQWSSNPPPPPPPAESKPWAGGLNSNTEAIEAIEVQIQQMQEQIRQSEHNLTAQQQVLAHQQQVQVDEGIQKKHEEKIRQSAVEVGVDLNELQVLLQPIMDSCTKDSISSGKGWIFNNATSDNHNKVISNFLLMKIIVAESEYAQKLHLVYLVNDVLHHCVRRNADDLRKALESVVVPMFCNAMLGASEEHQAKLNKLLTLWESKSNYFDEVIIEKLRDPNNSWKEYQAAMRLEYTDVITPIAANFQHLLEGYRSQHQTFLQHINDRIKELEAQKHQLTQAPPPAPPLPAPVPTQPPLPQQSFPPIPPQAPPQSRGGNIPPYDPYQHELQDQYDSAADPYDSIDPYASSQDPYDTIDPYDSRDDPYDRDDPFESHDPYESQMSGGPGMGGPRMGGPRMGGPGMSGPGMSGPRPPWVGGPRPPGPPGSDLGQPPHPGLPDTLNFNQPPPGFPPPGFGPPHVMPGLPDLSKPPPGFTVAEPWLEAIVPTVPYYELPAGLMVPLIKLEATEYRSIDPADIRLPAPAPPTERLLRAVEAFYGPPSHERPRDSEGWERLGLYEYYKAKNASRKRKEDDIANGLREKSRTPSPVIFIKAKSKSPIPKKRYTSKSPSPISRKKRSRTRSRSRTPSRRRNMSPVRTPPRRSRSRSRTRSGSPPSYSLPAHLRKRSPTPPSFFGSAYGSVQDSKLDESNKGHQMLKKMGWSGAGLGTKEQGIEEPISGGEVRDRQDLYKGVGVSLNDPYESFRKSKGQAFINRMKARADERS